MTNQQIISRIMKKECMAPVLLRLGILFFCMCTTITMSSCEPFKDIDEHQYYRLPLPTTYSEVIKFDRHILANTGPFLSADLFEQSGWDPLGDHTYKWPFPSPGIDSSGIDFDEDQGDQPSFADAISYSAILMYEQYCSTQQNFMLKIPPFYTTYLEIGVMAGKTFRQVSSVLGSQSTVVGLDQIRPNPRLEQDGGWINKQNHGLVPLKWGKTIPPYLLPSARNNVSFFFFFFVFRIQILNFHLLILDT